MKAQLLKISGHKNLKDFYGEFPDEASFKAKYGKELRKARLGMKIQKAQAGANVNITDDKDNNGVPDYLQGVSVTPQSTTPYPNSDTIKGLANPFNTTVSKTTIAPTSYPKGKFNTPGIPTQAYAEQTGNKGDIEFKKATPKPKSDPLGAITKGIPVIGGLIGGLSMLGAEEEQLRAERQAEKVSGLQLAASNTTDIDTPRQLIEGSRRKRNDLMPVTTGSSFANVNGTGTNVLNAEDGAEIQNTYGNGYSLYDDGGYEPLNDSDRIKSFQDGGEFDWQGLSQVGTQAAKYANDFNAGSQIGDSLGQGLDLFVPGAGQIASPVLSMVGGMLDTNTDKIKDAQRGTDRNNEGIWKNAMTNNLQKQNASYMEDGGNLTPIDALGGEIKTTWGGHAETISHNPYTPGSGEMIKFKGNSHDQSDGNGHTGIGVVYGEGQSNQTDYAEFGTKQAPANVEVEEEPGYETIDPTTGEKSLLILGNLHLSNNLVSQLKDPEINELVDKYGKNRKFKHIGEDVAKNEMKANKQIEKAATISEDTKTNTKFDVIANKTAEMKKLGGDMKLKKLADDRKLLGVVQSAINETKDEMSDYLGKPIDAAHLAKGNIKVDVSKDAKHAKNGKLIPIAQSGDKIKKFDSPEEAITAGYKLEADGKYHLRTKGTTPKPTVSKLAIANKDIPRQSRSAEGLYGGITPTQFEEYKKKNDWYKWDGFNLNRPGDVLDYENAFNAKAKEYGSDAYLKPDDAFGQQVYSANINMNKNDPTSLDTDQLAEINPVNKKVPNVNYKRSKIMDAFNMVLPYIRPSNQMHLDNNQLMGENYALSNNQLEHVQARGYHPQLELPYDISYQDQLNANQGDFNAIQRLTGNNPAALSILAGQKYGANEKVLGEQFRQNQAEKAGVYNRNTATLNDAQQKNLAIYDNQYIRQAEALSNTKATTQAALNSISSKIQQNKFENKNLGIAENMYNYRYDSQGRAINMNPLYQANIPTVGSRKPVFDKKGNVTGYVEDDAEGEYTPIEEKKSKNGSVIKNNKNSSVVRAMKNL